MVWRSAETAFLELARAAPTRRFSCALPDAASNSTVQAEDTDDIGAEPMTNSAMTPTGIRQRDCSSKRMSDLPSLNANVLPLAVATLHGHAKDAPNGDRVLQLRLDAEWELRVVAQHGHHSWRASADLCRDGERYEGECSTPYCDSNSGGSHALVSLAERNHLRWSLAHSMRKAFETHSRSALLPRSGKGSRPRCEDHP